ncbi:MAG: 23S rRNA (uracil(1939)-C(5))-methyltransferase RlmD [Gloeomargarita sp. GMQP_bins_120]
MTDPAWRQGAEIALTITDLNDQGDGVGRWQERVVFVPNTVPGDQVRVRLVWVKPSYAYGTLLGLDAPSPHRVVPLCPVADTCGGCQWQHIDYSYQLVAKQRQIEQALIRIGGLAHPPVAPVPSQQQPWAYRNKVTYPLGLNRAGELQAGFYQKNTHHIVNINRCPVQDPQFDVLLPQLKQDLQQRGWSIYNETTGRGALRHLNLRIGRRTGEVLMTLVSTTAKLPHLQEQARQWQARWPQVVGVCVHVNPKPGNTIFAGETHCVWGRDYLWEEFCGLRWQIRPDTFFQVNTEQAEQLVNTIQKTLVLQGSECLVDAYCGIGTLGLPLARSVRQLVGIEVHPAAIHQAQANARHNRIPNAQFHCGTVETLLPQLALRPDVILLDPPRKGCDPQVMKYLQQNPVPRLVYVSCNPATLARDLRALCTEGPYCLEQVIPLDFFPQTHHVESVSFLRRRF